MSLKLYEENRGRPPAKLTLEIEPQLIQEYVVALLDHGIQVGFTDIARFRRIPRSDRIST